MKYTLNGVFAAWKIRRTEFLPSDFSPNRLFAEHYDILISQVNFSDICSVIYCERIFLTKNFYFVFTFVAMFLFKISFIT